MLIGAAFALFQFLHNQKEAQKQQQTAQDQFRQQQKTAHDLLISNQVSKGFEQLASDKMAMRLGGINALEGVMNTSDQYHRAVVEALCAFIRENTTVKTGSENEPAIDVQAALTVIGRSAKEAEVTGVDLGNVKNTRRQPEQSRPDPRLPERSPPVRRLPEQSQLGRRHPDRPRPERSRPERR